jgi:hypothetical protein
MPPDCSPELDLLERLSAENETLRQCSFGFPNRQHLRRTLNALLHTGSVRLLDTDALPPRELEQWEWRGTLDRLEDPPPNIVASLTDRGYDQFVNDSVGFFERLFRD